MVAKILLKKKKQYYFFKKKGKNVLLYKHRIFVYITTDIIKELETPHKQRTETAKRKRKNSSQHLKQSK